MRVGAGAEQVGELVEVRGAGIGVEVSETAGEDDPASPRVGAAVAQSAGHGQVADGLDRSRAQWQLGGVERDGVMVCAVTPTRSASSAAVQPRSLRAVAIWVPSSARGVVVKSTRSFTPVTRAAVLVGYIDIHQSERLSPVVFW